MTAIMEPTSMVTAMELLSYIWMEVAMAGFAAVVYFTVSGAVLPIRGGSYSCDDKQAPIPRSKGAHSTPSSSAYQPVSAALRQGNVEEALALLKDLPETLSGYMPTQLASCLLLAAARSPKFSELLVDLPELRGKFAVQALEAALIEPSKRRDTITCHRLHDIARAMSLSTTHRMFESLVKAYASDPVSLRALLEDAGTPLSKPVAQALLNVCMSTKNVELAAEVFERIDENDAASLREAVEQATAVKAESNATESVHQHVLAKTIRSHGKSGNLKDAIDMFERYTDRQVAGPLLYNSLMEACIECGDSNKAMHYFEQARDANLVDVVSYNTMIKGHLSDADEDSAKKLLRELSEKGLTATHASYHGLLNARVVAGDLDGAWKLTERMQSSGIEPNAVTCSILLKGPTGTTRADLFGVMKFVNDLKEPMDEVLFSSLAEALIRFGRLDLLSKQLEKFKQQSGQTTLSAPTYGSMIKAYGQARDVVQVWNLWGEMANDGVKPTAVTLGCMVEALVANKRTREAWQLVQALWLDEITRPLVNTVIYSTILKGFAMSKESNKVMAIYEEMLTRKIQPNTITYNTILNAFAQSGDMHRVPALLEDMKSAVPPAEPDIVTYSTIVKGFCSSGNLDRGLAILKEMKDDGKYMPDEVMYNVLLNGCSREQRLEDALWLLEDMKKAGVAPSNYTLSMLVKLMGRCRRLNQAFSMVEMFTREHGVKINIQVYTCLIQACFNNRQVAKALAVHDQILKEGVTADEMTYTALVRGCLNAGAVDKAVHMARFAYGLIDGNPTGPDAMKQASPGVNAQCLEELVTKLGGVKSGAAHQFLASIKAEQKGCRRENSKQTSAQAPWRKRSKS
mmetsp:Transcript_148626/g.276890  ORF Transcript_148626/g.276890 Transcript_148626/m.276890 type:complete len:856 (+) Transcript_148626:102-2669(+)